MAVLSSDLAFGGWTNIATWNKSGSCGFFFDAKTGFIGLGIFNSRSTSNEFIKKTTDGGVSWNTCQTPTGQLRVTAIQMVDYQIGFASVMNLNSGNASTQSIWKTTDGGNSWNDFTQGNSGGLTCVYATSKAIVTTSWFRTGGSSIDNGVSYSQLFVGQYGTQSNGVAFLNDNIGVVTMGPDQRNRFGNLNINSWTYITSDGGISWQRGADLRESWGIYADTLSQAFYSMAEDNANDPGTTFYSSVDNGRSWQPRFLMSSLGSLHFTGHCAGVGTTVYVQTDNNTVKGLLRTDDGGNTWKMVGGPSNTRDTRFVVTGCRGEVVYAFDNNGGIWKTSDGGDGTRLGGQEGAPPLLISPQTISFSEQYCSDSIGAFYLSNVSCFPFTIDSIGLLDTTTECSITHLPSQPTLDLVSNDSVVIAFSSRYNTPRTLRLRIRGSSNVGAIDTIMTISINRSASFGGPTLSLGSDTLILRSAYCNPAALSLPLVNKSCSIMDVTILSTGTSDTDLIITRTPARNLPSFAMDSFVFVFSTRTEQKRLVPLTLHCVSPERTFDTIVYIQLLYIQSPVLTVDAGHTTTIGSELELPIMISKPYETTPIDSISFLLRYNSDLLSVKDPSYRSVATISALANSIAVTEQTPGAATCTIKFSPALTNAIDYSQPLIALHFNTYLTTTRSTPTIIDSFAINGLISHSLCPQAEIGVVLSPVCGDSIISYLMLHGKLPAILAIQPNPASDRITIHLDRAGASRLKLELFDALGATMDTRYNTTGDKVDFLVGHLPLGPYLVRLSTDEGYVCSARVVIER